MFEYSTPVDEATKDALFLERLETLFDKTLGDIKNFSERELRPYEETRRCIAQWHATYLFQSAIPSTSTSSDSSAARSSQIRTTLCNTSRILESLSATAGVQSFLLAVDPYETSDAGFLGGSLMGREFWRGLRGGGEFGARTFKTNCAMLSGITPATTVTTTIAPSTTTSAESTPGKIENQRQVSTPPPLKVGSAKSLKTELYEVVRTALRKASGVRGAEMKWTNPERLDMYGVRLVGWPDGIPAQNPSTLKVKQNKTLLDAVQKGTMKFEKLAHISIKSPIDSNTVQALGANDSEDFSWAYHVDAQPPSPLRAAGSSSSIHVAPPGPSSSGDTATSSKTSSVKRDLWIMEEEDPDKNPELELSLDDMNYTWSGDYSEQPLDTLDGDWDNEQRESSPPIGPPRKKLRTSVEPLSEVESMSTSTSSESSSSAI